MVYNPANGLFYLSIPSTAGSPYANSVVSIDPATGNFGTPVLVGSEPDQMAISSDGQYLWVALDGARAVRQVNLSTGTAGLQFLSAASLQLQGQCAGGAAGAAKLVGRCRLCCNKLVDCKPEHLRFRGVAGLTHCRDYLRSHRHYRIIGEPGNQRKSMLA